MISSALLTLMFLCAVTKLRVCESLRFPIRVLPITGYLSTLKDGKFICRSALQVSSKGEYGDEVSSLKRKWNVYRRTEDAFNQKMKSTQVALFESFPTYVNSLPVRYSGLIGSYIRLCTLDYIVRPEDLTNMALRILKPSARLTRYEVRYLSAPEASGKTSSVLPAFLESASMEGGGTHYLYIACNNNDARSFQTQPFVPSSDIVDAELQGAAFMVQCVKNLLERPDDAEAYRISIPDTLKNTVEDYVDDLAQYLREKLGDSARVWFHVDGHRKMCDISPAFSRGAMQVLAMVDSAIVVATCTVRPDLPAEQSDVCRIPIALPLMDVNQVMSGVVPELRVDSTDFSAQERRLLSFLKLRLGFKIKELDIISILHMRGIDDEAEVFLSAFQEAMQGSDRVQALKDCIDLCNVSAYFSANLSPFQN